MAKGANMTAIHFNFDATGAAATRESLHEVGNQARVSLLRVALANATHKSHRAYLNMLRGSRKNRKALVRKWHLAKVNVQRCKLQLQNPTAQIKMFRRGGGALFETIFASGTSTPSRVDLRTMLLGRRTTS